MKFLDYIKAKYKLDLVEKFYNSKEENKTSCFILNTIKFDKTIIDDIKCENHPFVKNAFYFNSNDIKLGTDYRFDNGAIYIQDASAMMNVANLGIEQGDIILDMCAAPGGKTIDAALELNGTGQIIANEINYTRAKVLSNNIDNMGLSNVVVTNNDLSKIFFKYKDTFDKIILDAPCSGSFMFRKNSLAEKDWSFKKVQNCAKTQIELLEYASFMVKPGGKISYSTCSLSPEENEEIINEFIKKHDDFKLIDISNNSFYSPDSLPQSIYYFPWEFKGEGQFVCVLQKDGAYSKTKKYKVGNSAKNPLYEKYNLSFSHCFHIENEIYVLDNYVNLKYFFVLKYGLKLCDFSNGIFIPSFQLAHYLSSDFSISLTEDEAKNYINGCEIKKLYENGYHIVSFNGVNLGFVKSVGETLKNMYPKGLRKNHL